MPFNLSGRAEIAHLNIRKGASDESSVSLDIKLKIEDVPSATAAAALGADSSADVEAALFRPVSQDADRNARFLGLKGIACDASWEDKHAVTIKGFRKVRVHRVSKIELKPRAAGKFDLVLQITIEQPPQGYVEQLAEYLNATLAIELEHDAELPMGAPKNIAPAADTKPRRGRKPGSKNKAAKAA